MLAIACAGVAPSVWGAPPEAGKPRTVEIAARPNILLIVADDLGYSEIGPFGSEIATPNLDALARRGTLLTHFYVNPTCSPTRAMLLTGVDNHRVGVGKMAEVPRPNSEGPAFAGTLNHRAATIAEQLGASGYATIMSGKWHLGMKPEELPTARGFQRSFALLDGEHNHFGTDQVGDWAALGESPSYDENGVASRFPIGAFSADYFASRMVGFLREVPRERPFFAYLTFTVPHLPLQAPAETIAKYRHRYDAGPARFCAERLAKMRKAGLPGAALANCDEPIREWESLSPEARLESARRMEVYAAMIDRMDHNIGRVLAYLRSTGRLSNTVVLFMSDNGAARVNVDRPHSFKTGKPIDVKFDNSLASIGSAQSFVGYGREWSTMGALPARGLKGNVLDGGVESPAIIAGPRVGRGKRLDASLYAVDVVSTFLDIAHASPIKTLSGRTLLAPTGLSWSKALRGQPSIYLQDRQYNWEFYYQRAGRRGNYKIAFVPQLKPFSSNIALGWSGWQLFDTASDPLERHDLSGEMPDLMRSMISNWHAARVRNEVGPLDGGSDMPSLQPDNDLRQGRD